MTRYVHADEGRRSAIEILRQELAGDFVERAVAIDDLMGRLRLIVWATGATSEAVLGRINKTLGDAIGSWWSGDIWNASEAEIADRAFHESAWTDGRPDSDLPKLRIVDRVRNRGAWFQEVGDPLWPDLDVRSGKAPAIIVFYSFKGGVGRTTALASFAIQRARMGERVVVVDFDLDAPGLGTLLAAEGGVTAPWGVIDYLMESPVGPAPIEDYYHPCRRLPIVGDRAGEILVFPAGVLDSNYISKLAKVDTEGSARSVFTRLLSSARDALAPKWILIDSRAGLSEPAGLLLSGIAHYHVLFGTTAESSWRGLTRVIDHLGAARVRADQAQRECALVQAMVPPGESSEMARAAFATRAREEFTDHYFAPVPDDAADERFWDVRDLESQDGPHVPVPITYDPNFAHFRDLAEVADRLDASLDHRALASRIAGRFEVETGGDA